MRNISLGNLKRMPANALSMRLPGHRLCKAHGQGVPGMPCEHCLYFSDDDSCSNKAIALAATWLVS